MSLVDWSRAQFALTAIYHWLFVPLTLGLSFIIAIMESIYVRTGNQEWKKMTKFWMSIFGVNFAIGVATGIILEFEFGTNWSNYSWVVGDIFGAPLAVEGIMAFFLESTFVAVMFFGWDKVSKKFHLLSTWLVAFGSNLSALWILVANGWMQNPTGIVFNPDTARSEMINFWEVLFNPMAVHKFLHTIGSGYVTASLVVVGVSAWFLLKKRDLEIAKKSIMVAAVFGLLASVFVAITGDSSGRAVAKAQPMKLAAMEGLYEGQNGAPLIAIGVLNTSKTIDNKESESLFAIKIPYLLSAMATGSTDGYVPGIKDLVYGNEAQGIEPVKNKIQKGEIAIDALKDYKKAKKQGDKATADQSLKTFQANFKYMGYGYLENETDVIPPVGLTFYSFHLMAGLGFFLILFFMLIFWWSYRDRIADTKWLLRLAVVCIPLGYVASELGWIVAEVGRQPWAIQNLLPVSVATSHISTAMVQTTFFMFLGLFTLLLIADIRIILKQIKNGPKGGSHV